MLCAIVSIHENVNISASFRAFYGHSLNEIAKNNGHLTDLNPPQATVIYRRIRLKQN